MRRKRRAERAYISCVVVRPSALLCAFVRSGAFSCVFARLLYHFASHLPITVPTRLFSSLSSYMHFVRCKRFMRRHALRDVRCRARCRAFHPIKPCHVARGPLYASPPLAIHANSDGACLSSPSLGSRAEMCKPALVVELSPFSIPFQKEVALSCFKMARPVG